MRSAIFILLTMTLLPTLADAQAAADANYINYKYKAVTPDTTLPNGVKHTGGGLVGDINADPVYGISQVLKGGIRMLWLEVSTGHDTDGSVSGWQVIDVLSFPALSKSDYLFFGGDPSIECRRKGSEIEDLVGVGRIIRKQGIFKPSKLWVANLTTKKFDPLVPAGVKCTYSEP